MMKLVSGVFGLALILTGSSVQAQTDVAATKAASGPTVLKTFFLHNVSQASETNEVQTALRNMIDPTVKIYYVPSQNAIVMRAPADQIALAQQVLDDLDKPKRSYRLTYTITELDAGKQIGVQHSSIVVVSGQRTTLKNGSKVPIQVSISPTKTTELTYLDVGLNIDASLDESVNGVRLRSKVERSSVAEERPAAAPDDPIIRQSVLEGSSILSQGKPMMLGSFDFPGTTRHMDLEVVMELAK